MPELPEVETVKRGLEPVLAGRKLAAVKSSGLKLRAPLPEKLENRLIGRTIKILTRRAKFLLLHLDDGMVLIVHLGMSGRMNIVTPNAVTDRHDHLILDTDDNVRVIFRDPRRFGLLALASGNELSTHPLLGDLGPEPLEDDFDGTALLNRLGNKKGPIKPTLLDQTVVAGIGNIYASEALFRARIDPKRPAGALQKKEADLLAKSIRDILNEAIESGGSTLRDHARPDGELGYFQHHFNVYAKEGQPCPGCDCGESIKRIVQGGRSTFYCAKRQS
jgi:formamidopyrimidine-DNA glycosylase